MKGNDGTGNKVDRDDWETPQWLFDKLNDQYKFEFDCCATENNSKCRLFSSNLQDNKGIPYISWMNPPFSKADIMIKHFLNMEIIFTRKSDCLAIYLCLLCIYIIREGIGLKKNKL